MANLRQVFGTPECAAPLELGTFHRAYFYTRYAPPELPQKVIGSPSRGLRFVALLKIRLSPGLRVLTVGG
jgi:hypothetical protein